MPSYTRGVLREDLTFVAANQTLYYGWKSRDLASVPGISEGELGLLGHYDMVGMSGISGALLVTGANSPKPPRVVKRNPNAAITAAGSVSTFCAYDALGAAMAQGWTLAKKGHGVRLTASTSLTRKVTAIATLSNGIKYAFPLDKADFTAFAADLGLESAEQMTTSLERRKLVTGCQQKPGTCAKRAGTGNFSSFYSTASKDAVVANGYNILTDESNLFSLTPPAP